MDSYELILADIDQPYQLHNYYSEDEVQEKKEKHQKETEDHSILSEKKSIQESQQEIVNKYTFTQNSLNEKFEFKNREKNRIIVNSQRRKKYLKSKLGKNSKSNDLSVNIGTLFKSAFNQFETFFLPSIYQSNRLKQFKNAKQNLTSLRKLLQGNHQSHLKSIQSGISDERRFIFSSNQNENSFKSFIIQFIRQTQSVKQIFRSKKMSFTKKIMLIRFFGVLIKSCYQPQNFFRWK